MQIILLVLAIVAWNFKNTYKDAEANTLNWIAFAIILLDAIFTVILFYASPDAPRFVAVILAVGVPLLAIVLTGLAGSAAKRAEQGSDQDPQ